MIGILFFRRALLALWLAIAGIFLGALFGGFAGMLVMIVVPVIVAVTVAGVIFFGVLYGWNSVFNIVRPQREYRRWARSQAQRAKARDQITQAVPGIPAPSRDDPLRDPDQESLIYLADLQGAEKYFEEAIDRARGGEPARLPVYTHYLQYLFHLKQRGG